MSTGARNPQTLRLPTGQFLPDLRIVAAAEVFGHEDHDPVRVDRLVASLREDGVLRNPPVAAPLSDGGYVVLDGANRAGALASFGIAVIPLQVVDYNDAGVELKVWHHFVAGGADLPSRMSGAGLTLETLSRREAEEGLSGRALACYLVMKDTILGVRSGSALGISLARVVAAYRGSARIYRVQGGTHAELARSFGTDGTLIVFPSFTKEDIVAFARARGKLPTGITRHVISGRALRLNLALDALSKPGGLEEKNRWLSDFIRQKLLNNRIRYYPEATFLFDE